MNTYMVFAGIMFVVLATGGANVSQGSPAVRLAASVANANPVPTASPNRELDKHHGTSGTGPDSMGSGTKPMPGEPRSEKGSGAARPMGGTGGTGAGH